MCVILTWFRIPVPLSRIDFTNIWEPEVGPHCGPLYFGTSLISPSDVATNGSFGLVDTGKKKLLVTCWHVWDGFCRMKEQNNALKMFICLRGGPPVVLASAPIDSHKTLDLATFNMEPLLPVCAQNRFYEMNQSPPCSVARGDRLFLLGYPGHLREVSPGSIEFGCVPYAVSVESVDGFRFHSNISKATYEDESKTPPPDRHAGISGSPCFRVREPGKRLRLAGFATSLLFGNCLGFVTARRIQPDGTLDRQGL
jgi:hypothetical protein